MFFSRCKRDDGFIGYPAIPQVWDNAPDPALLLLFPFPDVTLLGLQPRLGDKVTWGLSGLSPKRDCGPNRATYTLTREKSEPALKREKSLGHHIEVRIGTSRFCLPYLHFALSMAAYLRGIHRIYTFLSGIVRTVHLIKLILTCSLHFRTEWYFLIVREFGS